MGERLPLFVNREAVLQFLRPINRKCPTGCRNYAAFLTMYRCGLRVGEVCNLGAHDVHFDEQLIFVRHGKGNKDRVVPMDNSVLEACRAWQEIRPSSPYFFCTLQGTKIRDVYFRQVCYRLSDKSGVYVWDGPKRKPLHPHILRHCFATELLKEGYDIREVQFLLGHAYVNTTQIYCRVLPQQLTEKIRQRGLTS